MWWSGSFFRIASISSSDRYLLWSSEEEWESSRTTIASTRSGPPPFRIASIFGRRVRYISVNRVPSTRIESRSNPRPIVSTWEPVWIDWGTEMA